MPGGTLVKEGFEQIIKRFPKGVVNKSAPEFLQGLKYTYDNALKGADEISDLVKTNNLNRLSELSAEGNLAQQGAQTTKQLRNVAFSDQELVSRISDKSIPKDERLDLLSEPNIERAFKGEAKRVQDFAATPEGQLMIDKAYEQWEKTGSLSGLQDKIRGIVPRNKKGKGGIDTVNKKGITLQSLAKRDFETLKRQKTTHIPLSKVQALGKKFGASPEQVDAFMKMQKQGFKQLNDKKTEINRKVVAKLKAHPEWAKAVKNEIERAEKESIGHIRAAHSFEDSADIISNLELENLSLNTARSNKDELPEAVAIAFGASKNLEEEFLKFLDPQLGNFWKEMDFKKKTQIRKLLEQIDPETGEKWNIDDALKEVGFGGSNQTQNIPGVLTSPGADKDPALKATLNKLEKDGPSSLDSSGFGGRTNISDRD